MKPNYICILGALPIGITGYIWKSKNNVIVFNCRCNISYKS